MLLLPYKHPSHPLSNHNLHSLLDSASVLDDPAVAVVDVVADEAQAREAASNPPEPAPVLANAHFPAQENAKKAKEHLEELVS